MSAHASSHIGSTDWKRYDLHMPFPNNHCITTYWKAPVPKLWCKHARLKCLVLLQEELHVLVPWLLVALADLKSGNPALARRLEVAAMQLLPPLLDGLHARRLSRAPDTGGRAERLQPQPQPERSFTLVGTVAAPLRRLRTTDTYCAR